MNRRPPNEADGGAVKQAAEIRDSQLHRNLHLKFCVKARWKKQRLQNMLEALQSQNKL